MWAVYLCGPTDCFLHALFMEEADAVKWMLETESGRAPSAGCGERPFMRFYKSPGAIPRTDTGWPQ